MAFLRSLQSEELSMTSKPRKVVMSYTLDVFNFNMIFLFYICIFHFSLCSKYSTWFLSDSFKCMEYILFVHLNVNDSEYFLVFSFS